MRLLKLVPDNTNIGFVSLRGWAFGLTALLTVIAVFATLTRGLNLGVDFVGGLSIEASFPQAPKMDDLRAVVDKQGEGEANRSFGSPPVALPALHGRRSLSPLSDSLPPCPRSRRSHR